MLLIWLTWVRIQATNIGESIHNPVLSAHLGADFLVLFSSYAVLVSYFLHGEEETRTFWLSFGVAAWYVNIRMRGNLRCLACKTAWFSCIMLLIQKQWWMNNFRNVKCSNQRGLKFSWLCQVLRMPVRWLVLALSFRSCCNHAGWPIFLFLLHLSYKKKWCFRIGVHRSCALVFWHCPWIWVASIFQFCYIFLNIGSRISYSIRLLGSHACTLLRNKKTKRVSESQWMFLTGSEFLRPVRPVSRSSLERSLGQQRRFAAVGSSQQC